MLICAAKLHKKFDICKFFLKIQKKNIIKGWFVPYFMVAKLKVAPRQDFILLV